MDEEQFDDRPTCAACGQSFEWQAAYHSQDTPGSEDFNPPGHGSYRPRVYCPLCGELVIEWRIDRNKDYNRWGWVGENVVLNIGIPVPPDPRLAWGHSIPLAFLPSIQEHHLDIEKIKQGPVPAEAEPAEIAAVGAAEAAVVLTPADETIVDTPNTQADETKTCPECGKLMKLEEQVCPSCSARFEVFELGYCTTCHKVVRSDPQGHCPTCQGGLLDRRIASQVLAFAGAAAHPPREIPPAKLALVSAAPIDTPPVTVLAAETAPSTEWAVKEAPARVAKKRTWLFPVVLLAVFSVIFVSMLALFNNNRGNSAIAETEAASPAPAETQAAPVVAAALLPSPVLASPTAQVAGITPTILPNAKMICQESLAPHGFPTCLVTNLSSLSDPLWLAFTPFDPKGLNGYEVVVVSLADQRVIQPDSQGKVQLGSYAPGAQSAFRIEMNCTAPDGCPATTVYLTLLADNGELPIFGADGVYTLTREELPQTAATPTASPTVTPTSTSTPTVQVLQRATPTTPRKVKPTKPAGEPPPEKPPTVAPPPPTVAPN